MQYLILFLEGVITFISPCLLPMLPLYLSFFAAGEADRRRTLRNALGFVLGFTLVFVLMGAFAGTVGGLLRDYQMAVNLVSGGLVILLGLNFMGLLRLSFLNRGGMQGAHVQNLRFSTSLLFGLVFSIGWTPCVGAFLGSALLMASSQGGMLTGIFMLLVYSLGLGLPFLLSALLMDRLKEAFQFIKKHYKEINLFSGLLLVAVGLLMATGQLGHLLALLTF